jgi:D-alanyl-D-alanine carboxypeptidase
MNKRKKKRIVKNTVTYIVLILLLLLLIVFIVSLFDKPSKKDGDTAQTTVSDKDKNGKAAETITGTDTSDGSYNVILPESGTTTTVAKDDDSLADNVWAMFLVNNQNPLPADYDDTLKNIIGLTKVSSNYRDYYMDSRAAPYLIRMIADAKEDGIDLLVVSTYRTQEYQQQNLDKSVSDRMNQGMTHDAAYADALESVMLPGRSEHNAGLAADIMTPSYTSMDDDGFKNTDAYKWLSENAQKYGFILRYPEDKSAETGIIYEPWHYRFIGVYYATKVKESGLSLEEYFAKQGWVDKNGKAISHLGPVADTAGASVDSDGSTDSNSTNSNGTPENSETTAVTLPANVTTVTVASDPGNPIVV